MSSTRWEVLPSFDSKLLPAPMDVVLGGTVYEGQPIRLQSSGGTYVECADDSVALWGIAMQGGVSGETIECLPILPGMKFNIPCVNTGGSGTITIAKGTKYGLELTSHCVYLNYAEVTAVAATPLESVVLVDAAVGDIDVVILPAVMQTLGVAAV